MLKTCATYNSARESENAPKQLDVEDFPLV